MVVSILEYVLVFEIFASILKYPDSLLPPPDSPSSLDKEMNED